MSYDLAIWEGEPPANDAAAGDQYRHLHEHYISRQLQPPTPPIAAFVQALLDRYPDYGTEGGEDSPWADAPLMQDASGPFLYLAMVFSKCDEAAPWVVHLAQEHGLVCYDPQIGKLRP